MSMFSGPMYGRGAIVNMGCGMDEEDHEEELDGTNMGCKKCRKKHRRTNGRLGSVRMGDALTDMAKSAWDTALGLYGDLIKIVPAQAVGAYESRLKSCQAMAPENANAGQYYAATKCLNDLYKDIREGKGATQDVKPVAAAAPAKSEFPVVPVAVAGLGLAALGVVLWKFNG
jgi:hypothetical protein